MGGTIAYHAYHAYTPTQEVKTQCPWRVVTLHTALVKCPWDFQLTFIPCSLLIECVQYTHGCIRIL